MEEALGRQKRVIKLKKNSEFSYDEDSLQFLEHSREISQQQQQWCVDRINGEVSGSIYNAEGASGWSELNFLKYVLKHTITLNY